MRGHGVLLLVYPESFLRIRIYSICIARIGKTNSWRCYSLLKCIAIFGGSEIETWIYCLAINGMQQFTRLLYFFPGHVCDIALLPYCPHTILYKTVQNLHMLIFLSFFVG